MTRKPSSQNEWRISDMASHIPGESIPRIEPVGDSSVSPSPERIKELALEKRRAHLNRNEETPVKKMKFGFLLAAALVCIMSVTAFAALDGFGYIRNIFGDSADSIQNEVVTPYLSASDNGREMALEAVVTDGFVTKLVVSLTGASPNELDLFQVSGGASTQSAGWTVMDDFSTSEKTYYALELVSGNRFDTADITLSLNKSIASIDLSFQVDNNLGHTALTFPEGAKSGTVTLKELQVSPMGFLLIGMEDEAKGGLPETNIRLVFADGKTEDIHAQFSPSDETVSGGGGAVIGGPDQALPLTVSYFGSRNPDGELTVTGQFSRIIDASAIEKVIIDGVEYSV